MDLSYQPPPPAKVGQKESAIDTPALILDLTAAENNMDNLSQYMMQWPNVAVRTHAKAHKTPALAKLQVEHGAVGVCCQTIVEAEAMVHGAGLLDILLSNQLIGKDKLRRLAALAKLATVALCVDSMENISDVSCIAKETGVTIGLLIEVNVGGDRCGVEPGDAAVELAKHISKLSNVYFKGLQCYQGANQHVRNAEDRKKEVEAVTKKVKLTLQALREEGIDCKYITGGGTGTYRYEADSGVFTEVQPGSYVMMDVDYANVRGEDGKPMKEFEHSLYVLTTVISCTKGVRAVCNAGLKALAMDSGLPTVAGRPEIEYAIGGDQHGILAPEKDFKVGDQLRLIPGHCDPTCNMYDWMVGIRDGVVEAVWPILGRGP